MPLLYLSLERPQKNIKENKGKIYSPMASLYMLKPLKTKTLKTFMKSRGINDSKLMCISGAFFNLLCSNSFKLDDEKQRSHLFQY